VSPPKHYAITTRNLRRFT